MDIFQRRLNYTSDDIRYESNLTLNNEFQYICISQSRHWTLRERQTPSHLVWGAWNSLFRRKKILAIAPFVHILTISLTPIHPLLFYFGNKHGSRKYKYVSCIRGVKDIIPKISQNFPCVVAEMFLTDTPPRLFKKYHETVYSVLKQSS